MLTRRELATVLAALRFWQRHGPNQPDTFWDKLEIDEQDLLEGVRTDAGRLQPLDGTEIDRLCERINTGDAPCACEEPGSFCSGVPGILAHVENGQLAPGAKVERCDLCRRYASDEAAYRRLVELGMV